MECLPKPDKLQFAPFSRKPHDICFMHGASDEADVSRGTKMLRERDRHGSYHSLAENSEMDAANLMIYDHWMYMNCYCINYYQDHKVIWLVKSSA